MKIKKGQYFLIRYEGNFYYNYYRCRALVNFNISIKEFKKAKDLAYHLQTEKLAEFTDPENMEIIDFRE